MPGPGSNLYALDLEFNDQLVLFGLPASELFHDPYFPPSWTTEQSVKVSFLVFPVKPDWQQCDEIRCCSATGNKVGFLVTN